jgi:hypothetical protein
MRRDEATARVRYFLCFLPPPLPPVAFLSAAICSLKMMV